MRPPNYPVIHIKGMHFKNPFVVLPGTTPLTNPNGRVTPELLMYYKAHSRSEAALVITGPATVIPPNSRKFSLLRVDQPKYLDGLRALSKIVYSNGAIPGIQVTHPATYEANELQQGMPELTDSLGEQSMDKMVTAFRNACVRSIEVGFRYVELDAAHGLALHQMMAADQREAIHEIFKYSAKASKETILALRLHPDCPDRDSYATAFLEMGGDLVSLQADTRQDPAFFEKFRGHTIESIYQQTPAADLHKRLERCRLFSLPLDFAKKQKQVMSFF